MIMIENVNVLKFYRFNEIIEFEISLMKESWTDQRIFGKLR